MTIANEGREVCTNPLNLGLHQCQLLITERKIADSPLANPLCEFWSSLLDRLPTEELGEEEHWHGPYGEEEEECEDDEESSDED